MKNWKKWMFAQALSRKSYLYKGSVVTIERLEWTLLDPYPGKRPQGHDRGPLRGPENPCFEIPYVGTQ